MADLLSALEMAMWRIDNKPADYAAMMSVGFLRTHHAELEAAVRDAARYRHVRRSAHVPHYYEGDDTGLYHLPYFTAWDELDGVKHRSLDNAIDAAIAAMSAGEGEG